MLSLNSTNREVRVIDYQSPPQDAIGSHGDFLVEINIHSSINGLLPG